MDKKTKKNLLAALITISVILLGNLAYIFYFDYSFRTSGIFNLSISDFVDASFKDPGFFSPYFYEYPVAEIVKYFAISIAMMAFFAIIAFKTIKEKKWVFLRFR